MQGILDISTMEATTVIMDILDTGITEALRSMGIMAFTTNIRATQVMETMEATMDIKDTRDTGDKTGIRGTTMDTVDIEDKCSTRLRGSSISYLTH